MARLLLQQCPAGNNVKHEHGLKVPIPRNPGGHAVMKSLRALALAPERTRGVDSSGCCDKSVLYFQGVRWAHPAGTAAENQKKAMAVGPNGAHLVRLIRQLAAARSTSKKLSAATTSRAACCAKPCTSGEPCRNSMSGYHRPLAYMRPCSTFWSLGAQASRTLVKAMTLQASCAPRYPDTQCHTGYHILDRICCTS